MKRAAFHTLGCKVNTYDTEAMMELFEKSGYDIVDFNSEAEVYVINTCTVTNMGDRKSRQMIRRAKKQKEDSIIVVTGCYAQTSPEDLKKIPEVNLIVGNQDRHRIVDLVENIYDSSHQLNWVKDIMHTTEYEELKISGVKDRIRAFIKIQEGCNQFCSYCIIPYARGPIRSRNLDNIVNEAQNIAAQGYKEIVITGINVSSYGKDLGGISLLDVLYGIDKIRGIERIRLSSLEPMLLTGDFISKLANVKKLCDHFHLSLQSGCDKTLKNMNRKYTTSDYRKIVNNIRRIYPDCSITTDVMVGFPEESEEDFVESYKFIEEISFSKLHVFKYSKRKGTPAAKNVNQVAQQDKDRRSKMLMTLSEHMEVKYQNQFIGKEKEVLFEQFVEDEHIYQGHTKNYLLVSAESKENIINCIKNVSLKEINKDSITGKLKKD